MLRRQYSNVPGPRPAHYPEPGSRPQEGIPWARVAGRIVGERQITAFELMCARGTDGGHRPHQVVHHVLLAAIRAALDDPGFSAAVDAMMRARGQFTEEDMQQSEAIRRGRRRNLQVVR